jgi:MFS family permease
MSTEPLLQDNKNNYADLNEDHSTSLAGFVAEEVIEESYGSTNLTTTRSNVSNDPNGGYLLPFNQTVAVLIPLYLLVFLASLDSTILSTLMTDIASDLNAIPYISWIATAYLFSTSIVQPLGKLSDIFGRKSSLLICIIIFTIGCLQCATANSVLSFTSGRFLSGFAAGLNSLSTIITSDLIPLRNRGLYQGLGNIFFALGSAVGGTCGGWISERWGWRMAFWCQVPIGIAAFFVIVFYFNLPILPHEVELENAKLNEKLKKVDIKGILLIAFNLLILIIMSSTQFSNNLYYIGLTIILILGLYSLYKAESSHPFAIIPIELMKNRSVLGSSLANWFGTMYSYIIMYYFPVYLSTVLNIASDGVGLRLVPNIIAASLSSIGSGLYMKWSGKYLKFSIIINLFGIFGLIFMLFRTYPGNNPSVFEQFTLNTLAISAYASMITVTLLALIAAVPLKHQSSVTSIQYAFRSMGSTLGTSFSSYIFTSNLSKSLIKKLTENKPTDVSNETLAVIIDNALHDAKYIRSKDAPSWALNWMIYSYNISVWYTFVLALVTSIFGFIAVSMIKENKLHSTVKR